MGEIPVTDEHEEEEKLAFLENVLQGFNQIRNSNPPVGDNVLEIIDNAQKLINDLLTENATALSNSVCSLDSLYRMNSRLKYVNQKLSAAVDCSVLLINNQVGTT